MPINLSISLQNNNPDFIKEESLVDIFEATLGLYPQSEAFIFESAILTYEEADFYSNSLALEIRKLGLGNGDIIALWVPRGLDLHLSILGILKSGATYIPFDIETPKDRIKEIIVDFNIKCLVSFDKIEADVISIVPSRIPDTTFVNFSTPTDNAYIIFTSGSTGKPKGIPIQHRQISHLLRSENSILKIGPQDRTYQGFSVSFDMFFEETWLSILAGGKLIIADARTAKSFDRLDQFLIKNHVTVLHAVPSLLNNLSSQIPSLRIVNAGGEACTANVIEKWAQPHIDFYNSYGPTETTVTSSMIKINKDDELTIGPPLPNYGMAVVDEKLVPVALGEIGEIVISGPGVSAGYFFRDDLSAKVFLDKPISLQDLFGSKIYLSGDLGMMLPNGHFKVIGRKDDQIKLRGYRIEMGEIEAQLNAIKSINQAVVAVKSVSNVEQLVAYVILNTLGNLDEKEFKNELTKVLPSYMVPSIFQEVTEFKTLTSGKVDRKSLPEPIFDEVLENEDESMDLKSVFSRQLKSIFPGQVIREEDDFFETLGGHSLLAAHFVSEIRNQSGLNQVSIMDIYENRPLNKLFKFWDKEIEKTSKRLPFTTPTKKSYYICWLAQTMALFFIFGLVAAQIFIPFMGYYISTDYHEGHAIPLLIAAGLYCCVLPLSGLIIWLIKKLFIGRLQEGDYPLWGTVYFKWWFQKRLYSLIPKELLSGTPIFPRLLRNFGVQVASDAQISNFEMGAEELIYIGKNVTISSNVVLDNAWVENGFLKIRKIHIEDHCYLGTSSIISGDCILKNGSEIADLSFVKVGQTIPENEIWEGSPAKFLRSKVPAKMYEAIQRSKKIGYSIAFFIAIISFPLIALLPFIPSIISLFYLDNQADFYSFYYLFKTPIYSFIYISLFVIELIVFNRLLNANIVAGKYSIYSPLYFKKWFLDQLFALSLNVIKPIFATVYIGRIYRALGATVGNNTEISTASNVTPSLFTIGDESFIADDVVLGESEIRNQEISLEHTCIGNRSFVGNSALIPQGYRLGNGMLIGVLSVPPTLSQLGNSSSLDWFGSPSKELPTRERRDDYPEHLTFKPSKSRKTARAIIELIRILIPQSVMISLSILFIAYADDLIRDRSFWDVLLFFPVYYLGIVAIPCFMVTAILKWLVIGKYKKAEHPMWTMDVWLTEAVTSIYESLAVPFLLFYLKGTPYLTWALRILGVKIGKYVYLDSTDITEFDLVSIGDFAEINLDSGPQTHLFEDRVMKIGSVKIGSKSTIGARSVILYETEIGSHGYISPLSLVMKGEKLPESTIWAGIPIKS